MKPSVTAPEFGLVVLCAALIIATRILWRRVKSEGSRGR